MDRSEDTMLESLPNGSQKLKHVSRYRRAVMMILSLGRTCGVVVMGYHGCLLLADTTSYVDLLVHLTMLGLTLYLDKLVFYAMAPDHTTMRLATIEPLERPVASTGSSIIVNILYYSTLVLLLFLKILPEMDDMKQMKACFAVGCPNCLSQTVPAILAAAVLDGLFRAIDIRQERLYFWKLRK